MNQTNPNIVYIDVDGGITNPVVCLEQTNPTYGNLKETVWLKENNTKNLSHII
ncbi:hypothetical protein [Methanimicrococcus blatticola]|uniref:hypothetical protein n=1 Tax=Methanimicrococcus blatticola TaxID=91560 RepID=UPI0014151EB6|nr:hypothetical protein [Methanimicrococcus blatticola]MBZ3935144.1 hypothetical protein [Methanimicrococcus blatticola]MCC2508759.1 hypothetical protein [Methanimicrococcus blatticola]